MAYGNEPYCICRVDRADIMSSARYHLWWSEAEYKYFGTTVEN